MRSEFGSNIRSVYVSHYVIFFRYVDDQVEIVRVIRGDRDIRVL
ncbi:MAG: type II toxin-antitoxin system RelE/ParE family toxin [Pirellulales bacterium]